MTRNDLVREALEWIDTPYHHQQSVKGLGSDCIGLVRGVYATLTDVPVALMNYAHDWHVNQRDEILYKGLGAYMDEKPKNEYLLSDVLLFRMHPRRPASHCGIYVGDDYFVHSYLSLDRVIKTPYRGAWLRTTAAVFEFRELEDRAWRS